MKKIFVFVLLIMCSVVLSACSVRNKQKVIGEENQKYKPEQYDSYEYEIDISDEYDTFVAEYSKVDVKKILDILIEDDVNYNDVIEEEIADGTSCTYTVGDYIYHWMLYDNNRSFNYMVENAENNDDIDIDEADSIARKLLESYGFPCDLDDYIVECHDKNDITLSYRFLYNGVPILGNRNITSDRNTFTGAKIVLTKSIIEVSFTGSMIIAVSIDNVPTSEKKEETIKRDDFIGLEKVMSVVDGDHEYPSSDKIAKVSMLYIPMPEGNRVIYTPVYEVYFKDYTNDYTMNSTLLVNALTGIKID